MNIQTDDLQASLTESLKRHNVAGASVAVLHDGKITTAAAGVTNVTTGVPITPDTVMHIGSITKIFNATLMMQLVDEGTVDLDERVLRYLPDLRLKDRGALEQLTVKMLLNHTSGIDGEWLPIFDHDDETIEKAVERFAQLGQLFRPGTECSYCNVATVIAGYLMQRLTGKSWYRLVKERIFDPLQLEYIAATPEDALLYRASVGHHVDPADRRLIRTSFAFLSLSFAPAGSTLMASARDVITFARAHMAYGVGTNGTRILSERSAKAMQHMTVDNRGKGYMYTDGVGIGWMVSGDGLLFHSGGGPGIVSLLYVYPERDFAVAMLTNSENGLTVVNELIEPWLKEVGKMKPSGLADIQIPSEPVKIEPGKYAGVYEDFVNRYLIGQTPDGLALSRQGKFMLYDTTAIEPTQPVRMIPLGNEQFLLEGEGNRLTDKARIFTFRHQDAQGRMQYLAAGLRLYKRSL